MRPHRPYLVGLVCWVLIIASMIKLYRTMKQLGSPGLAARLSIFPYPPAVAETILFGTLAILVVSAICIYEGQGWARYIYFAVMVPFFIQTYLAIPYATLPDRAMKIWLGELAFFALSVVFLYLPQARRFFHPPRFIDE